MPSFLLDAQQPSIRPDDDEPTPRPLTFGPFIFGGYLMMRAQQNFYFDEASRRPEDELLYRPYGQLVTSAAIGEHSEFYSRISFGHRYEGGSRSDTGRADFEVREVYVDIGRFFHRRLSLRVGRQRFRDGREWLYDANLDAVRLSFRRKNVRAEIAFAQGITGRTATRDQRHLIGRMQFRLGDTRIEPYFLRRVDTARDRQLLWYGASLHGRAIRRMEYWLELAGLEGTERNVRRQGWAFDAGATYRFRGRRRPSLSVLYARGSGGDGTTNGFQQTGLNDNSSRYNGLRRFFYYGFVASPNLANLRVTSIDYGMRGDDQWSVNVSFHNYRQVRLSRNQSSFGFHDSPQGTDPRLGNEIDALLVWRPARRFELALVAGIFLPGPAFRSSTGPMGVFRQDFRFYF